MQDKDPLALLAWLVEAGAGEAIEDRPVNRLNLPLASGAPKSAPATGPSPPVAAHRVSDPQPRLERLRDSATADPVGNASMAAAAAGNLAELRGALETFDGSALKRSATHTVFADGVPESGIMVIGEAPGRDEDRIGRPFVGRAGQLLDKMLASIGLDRSRNCYITNVLNWRPPDNRDPAPEEAAISLPFLRRHIELVDPRVILLLGAVAARHVMGIREGIMKTRGHWLSYRVGNRMVPVLPTLHPAYLLRQPAHKKLAWRDLQALAAKLEELGLSPDP